MAQWDLKLPGGGSMPVIGLGTWQLYGEEAKLATRTALTCGYRLIDTAIMYENEEDIGDVLQDMIKKGQIKRERIFVTTKLNRQFCGTRERVWNGVKNSLSKLKLDYIDLCLIHTPYGFTNNETKSEGEAKCDRLVETWQAMEELVDEGKIKSIGLSNFHKEQIERILRHARHPVANHQVECNAYFAQPEMLEFCKSKGITMTSYAALGRLPGTKEVGRLMQDPTLVSIAEKYRKTTAQVLLRNLMQREIAVIPKSRNPDRIKQNIQVFDFELSADDMESIALLDKKKRLFTFIENKDDPEYPFKEVL